MIADKEKKDGTSLFHIMSFLEIFFKLLEIIKVGML